MNIEFLKSNLKSPARATLFDVEISGNGATQALSSAVLKFTCKAASLPSDTIGKLEVPFYGRKVPYAGDRVYNDWNTTIIMENGWTVYKELIRWKKLYNDPMNNTAVSTDMNQFKCDGYFTAYDAMGKPTLRIKLVGLFPYDVQQLDMDWSNTDTTADLNVTWFFDYWEIVN